MKISREDVVNNGNAAFYATIWPDLKDTAVKLGWALGLHGSLGNDMDIMAMAWEKNAVPVEVMIKALSDCFTDSPFKEKHMKPYCDKPHGRVVYTLNICTGFYLDINVIQC